MYWIPRKHDVANLSFSSKIVENEKMRQNMKKIQKISKIAAAGK